jgi:translation initiation factor IF-1
VSQRC